MVLLCAEFIFLSIVFKKKNLFFLRNFGGGRSGMDEKRNRPFWAAPGLRN